MSPQIGSRTWTSQKLPKKPEMHLSCLARSWDKNREVFFYQYKCTCQKHDWLVRLPCQASPDASFSTASRTVGASWKSSSAFFLLSAPALGGWHVCYMLMGWQHGPCKGGSSNSKNRVDISDKLFCGECSNTAWACWHVSVAYASWHWKLHFFH